MKKRLFAGFKILPQPSLVTYYNALQQELRDERIKWVDPQKMHITLWFFGDTAVDKISEIGNRLQQACRGIDPFEVAVKGCGYFGKIKNPSIIWFGLVIPETLTLLHHRINKNMNEIGLFSDRPDYKPHLTLGRIKEIRDVAKLKAILRTMRELDFQVTIVNSFSLFESILKPDGPEYLEIKKFTLV